MLIRNKKNKQTAQEETEGVVVKEETFLTQRKDISKNSQTKATWITCNNVFAIVVCVLSLSALSIYFLAGSQQENLVHDRKEQRNKEMVELHQKSESAGDTAGQYNLEKDVNCFEKAASQGDATAQKNLGDKKAKQSTDSHSYAAAQNNLERKVRKLHNLMFGEQNYVLN
eukprot:TRINITY_DN7967_c0_g1_i2.p1 TRINITY_DN7967_c0_g1~~TRINITY_DN7967_c0_g1_i2.p1  ORF type:complete len:170 (-),score=43.18 TRINITY_DN7967_c0_g1_i2:9-518(-)